MSPSTSQTDAANTLVITLVTLTILALLAGFTLNRVMPRVRMAAQNAAWQEARVASEAGIDLAVDSLLHNATGFNVGPWAGWLEGAASTDPLTGKEQAKLLKKLLGATADQVAAITAKIAKKQKEKKKGKGKDGGDDDESAATPASAVETTAPIFLDNVAVSAISAVPAEVDIRLWGLNPSDAHALYYRIRSTATCAMPPTATNAPAEMDAPLRRFSLRTVRPSLQKEAVGQPSHIPLPNVTRTVEVLVEPILPFELALWVGDSMTLPPTGTWNVDSFDSSDETKSDAGRYPGRGSPLAGINGGVACGRPRSGDTRYGPAIQANGTSIAGAVATNGWDDPATKEHENVSGASGIDPSRIRDDFTREMPLLQRPAVPFALPAPLDGLFIPGTEEVPTIYGITGNLNKVRILTPSDKAAMGTLVIMVDGDLDLAGPLIVPPSVIVLLYVRGNIVFRDSVNAGPWNSNDASQLLIFADNAGSLRQTLQVLGEISVCAGFYGPHTDVTLGGAVSWMGALAAGSLRVSGGGTGGLHFDEALATVGPPISYRISRYVEDVRE